jgi:hypothetical protein
MPELHPWVEASFNPRGMINTSYFVVHKLMLYAQGNVDSHKSRTFLFPFQVYIDQVALWQG